MTRLHLLPRLGTLLHQWGIVEKPFTTDGTYSKDSRIYIRCQDKASRYDLEHKLSEAGFTCNPDYYPSSSIVEVKVRYFHGYHWDE